MSKKKSTRGEGGVYLRGDIYWIRWSLRGVMQYESTRQSDEQVAKDKLREKITALRRGETVTSDTSRTTVAQLLELVVRDYDLKQRKNRKGLTYLVKHLLREGSVFATLRACEVGTKQVEAYRAMRIGQGLQPQSVNRELSLLRRAFNLAMEHEPPLVAKVPKFEMAPEADPRQGFFDRAMLDRLVAELPDYLKPVAAYAFWTGNRKGEIFSLRWKWVDADFSMIRIPGKNTKNSEDRIIPLVPELQDILRKLKAAHDATWGPAVPWVFTTRFGHKLHDGIYRHWNPACERAGLAEEGVCLIHDMRRSAVRNLVRAGVPESVAMAISGHKTRDIFERYNITDEADLRNAASLLHQTYGRPVIDPEVAELNRIYSAGSSPDEPVTGSDAVTNGEQWASNLNNKLDKS